eukprot:1178820-Rhodomonas_salina.2
MSHDGQWSQVVGLPNVNSPEVGVPKEFFAKWSAANVKGKFSGEEVELLCVPFVSKMLGGMKGSRTMSILSPDLQRIMQWVDGCMRFIPTH